MWQPSLSERTTYELPAVPSSNRPIDSDDTPSPALLAHQLAHAFLLYTETSHAELADDHDMQLVDIKALALLRACGGLPTGQLTQLLRLSPGGTTALINRLEQAGLAMRDRCPTDRRVVMVRTPGPVSVPVDQPLQSLVSMLTHAAEDWPPAQWSAAAAGLARLAQALNRQGQAKLQRQTGVVMPA